MIPRLHLVTDAALLRRPDFEEVARRLLAAGGPGVALHLRAPGTGGRLLWTRTAGLLGAAERAGALLVVNDRVDVASIAGASTVHLPGHGLPVSEARKLLGGGARVGLSVHGELPGGGTRGADRPDFVIAGTLYPTPSHPERKGSGVQRLKRLVRARPGLPVLGIGGITPDRVPGVRRAGAHGVAVMRAVGEAEDPDAALDAFLAALDEGGGTVGRSERDARTEPTKEICHV